MLNPEKLKSALEVESKKKLTSIVKTFCRSKAKQVHPDLHFDATEDEKKKFTREMAKVNKLKESFVRRPL